MRNTSDGGNPEPPVVNSGSLNSFGSADSSNVRFGDSQGTHMVTVIEDPRENDDAPQRGSPSDPSLPTQTKSASIASSSRTTGKSESSASAPLPTQVFDKGLSVKSGRTQKTNDGVSRKKSYFSQAVGLEQTKWFKGIGVVALVIALFGGGIFTLLDIPDDPGTVVQDTIMSIVTVVFIIEMVLKYVVDPRVYRWSFFFWMDLLGTLSMIFEVSYLLGTAGQMDEGEVAVNTVLLRTARAAKVGARAGRLTKVVKVISLLYWKTFEVEDEEDINNEARVLNAKLMTTLSTKVSMLTVALIMGVPLLHIGRYPEEDMGMRAWCDRLESDYLQAYNVLDREAALKTTTLFEETVAELQEFYADMWYYPYRLEGFNEVVMINGEQKEIPGESLVSQKKPARNENIVRRLVGRCRVTRDKCKGDEYAAIYYDFEKSRMYDAGMDMVLVAFIVLCMVAESADLSATLDRMVVKPLERMLGTVRMMAKVLSLVTDVDPNAAATAASSVDAGADDDLVNLDTKTDVAKTIKNEAELLENVFHKLAKLTAVFMQNSIADEVEMETMDIESKGVIIEVMGLNESEAQRVASVVKTRKMHGPVVSGNPYSPEQMASWELDIMGMQPEHREKVVQFAFFDSEIGKATGGTWVELGVFRSFYDKVRIGYFENPYHNFVHAVDVFMVLWRLLTKLQCSDWVSDVDLCALQVSALAHDIGHKGKTNPFLVETMHELAMRYNDKSPLENMHCSKMFDICTDTSSNIFKKFNKEAYKQARKVCITTILHTDNSLHFDMVKDVKKIYEVTSDICDTQAKEPDQYGADYMAEVLSKDVVLWLKLMLHLGDISTPLKPWNISKAWAFRVQDEFFAQGDEEKRLGIPVGMLNDRDKVNRKGAEHGFIVFLVSPLIGSAVGVFPALQHLAVQMASNLESWRNLWVEDEDAKPTPEDIKKRDADVQKIKDQVHALGDRKPISTIRNTP